MARSMPKNSKVPLGVVECFFGPPWPWKSRLAAAEFMSKLGMDFYYYGPKADRQLRMDWIRPWSSEYLESLQTTTRHFQNYNIEFGVILSPVGLAGRADGEKSLTTKMENIFFEKIRILTQELGVKRLGVFFDDIEYRVGMLESQIRLMNQVREETDASILYCPTFYSEDPILDKVFGQRPNQAFEMIGETLNTSIDVVWTGRKVITESWTASDLFEMTQKIRRKPFVCDNFYANDGPKNCQILKLKAPTHVNSELISLAKGWGINPMNEPESSKLALTLFMSGRAEMNFSADTLLKTIVESYCTPALSHWILQNQSWMIHEGLPSLPESRRQEASALLGDINDPLAREIVDWINGKFHVGSECLTD
ncbi:MAG: beta-N-acetylglucosaminidase domain-containing protein [Proteobacteria bacterium]|nr:beta-N-acetylglucosaminidase domain-containing protein [Pseudomonadota bacterium]